MRINDPHGAKQSVKIEKQSVYWDNFDVLTHINR